MFKNKKIELEDIRKQCLLPKDVVLTPEMVWENAHHIRDFMFEIGVPDGANSASSIEMLFYWSSRALGIEYMDFEEKFAEGERNDGTAQRLGKRETVDLFVEGVAAFSPVPFPAGWRESIRHKKAKAKWEKNEENDLL